MLYVVPTPIGNLEDFTFRAARILKEVDLVACEDTRTSGVLLDHYSINTPRTSYHEHNESKKAQQLVNRMLSGQNVAIISDAGTPGLSDPGFFLIRECIRNEIRVEVLPGPNALLPALIVSGLPTERFVFEGFLPLKKGRQARIKKLADEERTVVLYESPHRLLKTLAQLALILQPKRNAVICRELSKKFEEITRGTLGELKSSTEQLSKIRGEIVIVIAGNPGHSSSSE